MKEVLRQEENHSRILQITKEDYARSFEIDIGERIEISLPESHYNDYRWFVVEFNEKILKMLTDEFVEQVSKKRKAPHGLRKVVLEAIGNGETGIVLFNRRPPELGRELSEIFKIEIGVS